jgi:hypothetical protein
MLKIKLVERLARLIANNEGGFLFSADAMLTDSTHPQIKRWVATSLEALELVHDFLAANDTTFAALGVKEDLTASLLATAPKFVKPESEIVRVKIPTWQEIEEWVEELYLCWGVFRRERMSFEQYELDKVTALEDQFSHAQLQAMHDAVSQVSDNAVFAPQRDKSKLAKAILEMINPYPKRLDINLYFKYSEESKTFICVGGEASDFWAAAHKGDYTVAEKFLLPMGFNPYNRTLADIRKECNNFGKLLIEDEPEEIETQPEAQPEARPEAVQDPADLPGDANLYFDSNDVCLGFWTSWYTGLTDYKGMYAYAFTKKLVINAKTNPTGKKITEICSQKEIDHPKRDRTPKHTHYTELTNAEKKLLDVFAGREVEFERFRVIKSELAAIKIKVGNLISSQPDIKAWYVTGGTKGQDKAALYFTAWDGWEIDCRENQEALTGVFENWSVIQHLDDNGIQVNGIAAGDWHNARCEKAEAEALELQKEA